MNQPQDPGEVHTIVVEAQGSDGRQYRTELDLVYPSGSRITEVREDPAPPPSRLGAC
jgi:hypothetical protein